MPMKALSSKKVPKIVDDKGVLKSMDQRDSLFAAQLGKMMPSEKYRNKVNKLCTAAMDLEALYSFKDIVDDPKKVWCKINKKFLNKKHCSSIHPSELIIGNAKITEKTEVATNLNDFFVK